MSAHRRGDKTNSRAPVSKRTSHAVPQRPVKLWQKVNQENVPFNRFRVGAYQPVRKATHQVQVQPPRHEEEPREEASAYELVRRTFVPILRGNSDPFSATVVH